MSVLCTKYVGPTEEYRCRRLYVVWLSAIMPKTLGIVIYCMYVQRYVLEARMPPTCIEQMLGTCDGCCMHSVSSASRMHGRHHTSLPVPKITLRSVSVRTQRDEVRLQLQTGIRITLPTSRQCFTPTTLHEVPKRLMRTGAKPMNLLL